MQFSDEQLSTLKQDITKSLGLSKQPVHLNPIQTSEILHTSTSTLSVWRSTGRYNLKYVKVSRRILYPLSAVAEFLLSREIRHTSEEFFEVSNK